LPGIDPARHIKVPPLTGPVVGVGVGLVVGVGELVGVDVDSPQLAINRVPARVSAKMKSRSFFIVV
jgi:hypothetical protein